MLNSPTQHGTASSHRDRGFLNLALGLARRVLGTTAPNPAVGAVIVDEATGEVVARGWTQPGGRPHAEAHVLQRAGAKARGKTMYVTLEPCSHHGRTPPCAEAIVAAGISRVVCPIEDPNPEISGKGFASLRRGGVEVESGDCSEEARWMAAGHILRMTEARPFVQLKLAVSADGLIAPGDGAPSWVTGKEARAYAHLLRARADAILVGRKTVEDDDPLLTCRLPGLEHRSPRRYVLDTRLQTARTTKLVRTAAEVPVTLIGGMEAASPMLPPEVLIKKVPVEGAALSLGAVLTTLRDDGVTRLLVEGGPHVAGSFINADLVDEAVIARGTGTLGSAGIKPLGDQDLAVFADRARWSVYSERRFGTDIATIYRRRSRLGLQSET